MDIQTFIQDEILLPRLRRNGVLVIYDPAQRYRNLCLEQASETLWVVDATESSIESRERAMQALHLLALDPISETTADHASYGFRQARSCADAIGRCFSTLCHGNPAWILEGDIKGCFDNISHQWLLDHVPMDKTILC